jgi:zinc protease
MVKLTEFWAICRRYRWGALLSVACLSALLAAPMTGIPTQTQTASPGDSVALERQKTPSKPQIPQKPKQSNPTVTEPPIALTKGVKKAVLPNGLTVLMKEVKTAPVVTAQVWYKIGSRNEAAGVNGIAHQLEHMLFKGTKQRPIQFGRLFTALGSSFNAFTSYDQTAYFGTVEKNKLNSLLVLEADRMQNSIIDAKLLEGEKRVVISELQGYENSPGYRLNRAVRKAAFPNSPYGLMVGGTKADVQKFTPEQVRYYYDAYYSPSNASLVIVGDFDSTKTLAKVKEIFGKVPKRDVKVTIPPVSQVPPSDPQKRMVTLKEPGSTQILLNLYPLPPALHPDVPAIDVLNYILAEGRSSRMYQSIVETGMATSIDGGASNYAVGGWFEFDAIAEPGKPLGKIEAAIDKEIKLIQAKQPTSIEVARAKTKLRASYLLGFKDINSQARQLGNDITTTGDYQFTDKYLAGVEKVTAADVVRVANKYLKPELKTTGYFQPTKITAQAGSPSISAPAESADRFAPSTPVDPAEVAKYLPAPEPETKTSNQTLPQEIKLANGMRVFLLKDASTPTVSFSGNILAGTEYDSSAKAGVASLTAANLMNGTKSKTALQISKALEDRGAGIGFSASREGVGIGGSGLSKDLPLLVSTLNDVLTNATFPQKDFDLSRQRALTGLKLELDSPNSVARRKFQQTIYPQGHPFTNFPTQESLKAITRADLQTFHRQQYTPANTMLAFVGDLDIAKTKQLLENTLGKWTATSTATKLAYPVPQLPAQLVKFNPSMPGKTQSITLMGNKAIDRKDPRYYAALVLNQVLGGDTLSSRLGTEIRDRQGLTYGIYSAFSAGKKQGTFTISMQTAPEDTNKAINSTIALLKNIQANGLTQAEIDIAKRSIASNYTVDLASPDDIASGTLGNAVYGLDPKEIVEFPNKIRAVTLAQVNQAAKELIATDRLTIITAGPPQK